MASVLPPDAFTTPPLPRRWILQTLTYILPTHHDSTHIPNAYSLLPPAPPPNKLMPISSVSFRPVQQRRLCIKAVMTPSSSACSAA